MVNLISQFCFNITIVNDSVHEGSIPEQFTLAPFSASMPDLIQLPLPNVTIIIQDNDGVLLKLIAYYHSG